MEPEEIDKLFKDRLAGLPAMPSADAWNRLQQKMEPPKKERTMWVYYAAASISILLLIGFLFLRTHTQSGNPEVAVVKPLGKKSQIKYNIKNIPTQATETIATASDTKKEVNLPEVEKENQITKVTEKTKWVQNTEPVAQVSTILNKDLLADETKIAKQAKVDDPAAALEPAKPTASEPDGVVLQEPNTGIAYSAVQVVVKRDQVEENTSLADDESLKANLARKGILLKNIYKQARNLKNGEPVELAALGLNTEKIESESKAIKEKINKVISL